MIGISALVYDTAGAKILETDNEKDLSNRKGSRRVTITATLDGGVTVYDTGFSDGDRIISVNVPAASQEDINFAEHICRAYNLITVTMLDGAYKAVPESYKIDSGELLMTLRITEKISGN